MVLPFTLLCYSSNELLMNRKSRKFTENNSYCVAQQNLKLSEKIMVNNVYMQPHNPLVNRLLAQSD